MTVQAEYYLSCNKCDRLYAVKSDDPQGTDGEAVDDGWEVLEDKGTDGRGGITCELCMNIIKEIKAIKL